MKPFRDTERENFLGVDTAEEAVLQAGDKLSEVAYERYTTGRISQSQLKEAYRLLAEWTKRSEKLLRLME